MGTIGLVAGWVAFIIIGVTLGLVFQDTIWQLAAGLLLLVGIPGWAIWSTWNDRTRQ